MDYNSVLFTSAAAGGKSATDSQLTAVADYSGSEWKLTLLDSDRQFGVSTNAVTATTIGGNVSISYSGAAVGSNEYISAMLVDGSNNVLYYGRLKKITAANDKSGTVTFAIPSGLAAGSYTLKIFNEQYNGDKKTDYSSAIKDVALTVSSFSATVSVNNVTFAGAIYGYSPIEAQTVTITNTGDATCSVALPTLKNGADSNFTVAAGTGFTNNTATIAKSGTATFSVTPKTGLNKGTYTDKLTVTCSADGCTNAVISKEISLSFTVAAKEVTVEPGTYKVSKEYDGTTDAGTATGVLSITGILTSDTGVTVTATPVDFTNENAGKQTSMDVGIAITGDANGNYVIKGNATTLNVPCEIAKAKIDSFTFGANDRQYEKNNYTVEINSITFSKSIANPSSPASTTELTRGTDYTVGVALEGNDNNAGNHNVTVTVTLLDTDRAKNYEFANGTKTCVATTGVAIDPANQSSPVAPTLKSRTKHEIVLYDIAASSESGNAAEYSIDGENWQDSPKFKGLSTETGYTFYSCYKQSQNYNASAASEATFSTLSRSGIAMSTVHVYAGEHGSASPSGTVNVKNGDSKTLTFTPDAGYEIADVVVNHKSVGAVSEYTLKNIDGTVNVEITFVKSGNAVVGTTADIKNPATGAAF